MGKSHNKIVIPTGAQRSGETCCGFFPGSHADAKALKVCGIYGTAESVPFLRISFRTSVDFGAVQRQAHMKRCFPRLGIERDRPKMLLDDSLHGIEP